MNIVKYKYSVSDTYLDFEFDSDGPALFMRVFCGHE
jgi:hypothetical protein